VVCDSCWGYDAVLHPCLCEDTSHDDGADAVARLRPDLLTSLRARFRGLATTVGEPRCLDACGAD
jgi:hypothetical protein